MSAHGVRTPGTTSFDAKRFGSVPRDVRLTGSGVAVLVLAGMFAAGAVIAAIALSIVIERQEADRVLRRQDGVETRGQVTRLTRTGGDSPRLIVAYRYDVADAGYSGTARLPLRARRQITFPGAVAIAYLRSDPARSWIVGFEPRGVPAWIVPIASASLLLLAFALAWSVRRQRELLSEGRLAEARVLETKSVVRKERRGYRVRYEFQTMSGATIAAAAEVGRSAPAVGATIPIVYHRDNPGWSAPYPLPLVRPIKS